MMKSVLMKVKNLCAFNKTIETECHWINIRHIFFGAPFVVMIHAALIIYIELFQNRADSITQIWKSELVTTHSVMLICMLACFLITYYIRVKNGPESVAKFLVFFMMGVFFSGSIVLTSVDQLVTTNITPYILVSLVVGAFLLIHPFYSLLFYSLSFAAFYFVISASQLPEDILLSNKINALTSDMLGFLLTLILWRNNRINILQRLHITEQHRALEEANHRLEKMAFFDSLTGLPNRQYFDQVLQKEISFNHRMGYESYLIMLDVDMFKSINDMYGHPIGDALLIQIGKLLNENVRKYDTLCRLGGEEFLLLLPQTTAEEALTVAEKLRSILESYTFCIKDHILHITASFGVSRLSYSSDPQIIAQYAQVDNALYLAKQCGRNCVKSA